MFRTPRQGASTAVGLLLDEEEAQVTGQLYVSNKRKELSDRYKHHVLREPLWKNTEQLLARWLN